MARKITQEIGGEDERRTPLVLVVGSKDAPEPITSGILPARNGCRVLTANDGAACLKLSREENPDIIILDARLPDIGGLDLCMRLKKDPRSALIPVILMVGSDGEIPSEIVGSPLEPDEYLVSPAERHKLGSRIRTILRIKEQARSGSRPLSPLVAHKLRSPLNSIIGMAELLRKPFYGSLNDKQLQFAETISMSGSRLLKLINDLEGE